MDALVQRSLADVSRKTSWIRRQPPRATAARQKTPRTPAFRLCGAFDETSLITVVGAAVLFLAVETAGDAT